MTRVRDELRQTLMQSGQIRMLMMMDQAIENIWLVERAIDRKYRIAIGYTEEIEA
jgi:hypothetical protein